MRRWLVTLALLLAVPLAARAAPLDAALQQQLLGVYDGYNKALLAGKLPDAIKLRSAQTRASAQKEMPTAAARQRFLEMARTMVPDTLQVAHASINTAGDKASIITVAAKTIPTHAKIPPGGPAPGSTLHSELTLSFVKESDGWKLDDQMFGPDPARSPPARRQVRTGDSIRHRQDRLDGWTDRPRGVPARPHAGGDPRRGRGELRVPARQQGGAAEARPRGGQAGAVRHRRDRGQPAQDRQAEGAGGQARTCSRRTDAAPRRQAAALLIRWPRHAHRSPPARQSSPPPRPAPRRPAWDRAAR